MIISDILKLDRGTIPILLSIGMHCLGCPSSSGESLEDACAIHPTWTDVASAVRSALAGRSLADIAREDRELGVASRRRAARRAELARP
jgi:hybrid cluster-associated redox disulfide protein